MRRGGRGAGWMGGCKAWNLIGRAKYRKINGKFITTLFQIKCTMAAQGED